MVNLIVEERKRIEEQVRVDASKSKSSRNAKGQFATPPLLAKSIVQHVLCYFPDNVGIHFLEPSIGTGAFYSALKQNLPEGRLIKAKGIEIDSDYFKVADDLWNDDKTSIQYGDFTKLKSPDTEKDRYNLVISNPPYVRHQHIDSEQKNELRARTSRVFKQIPSGLSGLYLYFLGLAHEWLMKDAISVWLIPSEFMDVNYGNVIKKYLKEEVTLLKIHSFDPSDSQFHDALVTSSIVIFKNRKPEKGAKAQFSYGGQLSDPKFQKDINISELHSLHKWSQLAKVGNRIKSNTALLGDFFYTKRGIATGNNDFFILNTEEVEHFDIPRSYLTPILPSPRYLKEKIVNSTDDGVPILRNQLFLLNCKLPIDKIPKEHSSLKNYLLAGEEKSIHDKYLCKNRPIWYQQETREVPRLICTYIGRRKNEKGSPFRFILNKSKAIITNAYLAIYPKPHIVDLLSEDPDLWEKVWRMLNNIPGDKLIAEGRVYGGGMYKLEPKELMNIPIDNIWS